MRGGNACVRGGLKLCGKVWYGICRVNRFSYPPTSLTPYFLFLFALIACIILIWWDITWVYQPNHAGSSAQECSTLSVDTGAYLLAYAVIVPEWWSSILPWTTIAFSSFCRSSTDLYFRWSIEGIVLFHHCSLLAWVRWCWTLSSASYTHHDHCTLNSSLHNWIAVILHIYFVCTVLYSSFLAHWVGWLGNLFFLHLATIGRLHVVCHRAINIVWWALYGLILYYVRLLSRGFLYS